MLPFMIEVLKAMATFVLIVYALEALIVLSAFAWWYMQYRREARRGP